MSPILLVAFLVAVAAPGEGAALRMPPVDRCASDPSFAAFRTELRQAIAGKDRDFVGDAESFELADFDQLPRGIGIGREDREWPR